jgi:hypothetical protein
MTEELKWQKSSYSGAGTTNDCVEWAFNPEEDVTYVRDSKEPSAGAYALSAHGVKGLIEAVRLGYLDLPSA